MSDKLRIPTDGAVGAGIVLVLLPGIALFSFSYLNHIKTLEVGLPVVAIFGIMMLFGSMALVATLFRRLELSSPNEALGLPSGSVRAVIALSLIVLFAIIAIMLFHRMAEPYVITGLSSDDKKAIVGNGANHVLAVVGRACDQAGSGVQPAGNRQRIPAPAAPATAQSAGTPAGQTHVTPAKRGPTRPEQPTSGSAQPAADAGQLAQARSRDGGAALQPAGGAGLEASGLQAPAPSSECFDVHLMQPPGQEAYDLAKQLLVLIGTLMTSVTSFYFATQATAKAVEIGKLDAGKKPVPLDTDGGKPPIPGNQSASNGNGGVGTAGVRDPAAGNTNMSPSVQASHAVGASLDKDSAVDGCDIPVTAVTADADLPATQGGVAA